MAESSEVREGRLAGLKARRDRIRDRPALNRAYRVGVGVVGTLVLVIGLILVPYPGPGWLIVIGGLAILASEFAWAQRLLGFVKRYYDAWTDWVRRQSLPVQILLGLITTVVVLLTLWLLNTFSLVGGWFGYEAEWLRSPIFG